MISGYKQRCISETKTIKKKLNDGVDELTLDDEEKRLAAAAAVKSLRDKFVISVLKACHADPSSLDLKQSRRDSWKNNSSQEDNARKP
jgi:hypothetical protein